VVEENPIPQKYLEAITLIRTGATLTEISKQTGINITYLKLIKKWIAEGPQREWRDRKGAYSVIYRLMTQYTIWKYKEEKNLKRQEYNEILLYQALADEKALLYNSCRKRLHIALLTIKRQRFYLLLTSLLSFSLFVIIFLVLI
jgi:uncharacterized LabA/DUF88 family protein